MNSQLSKWCSDNSIELQYTKRILFAIKDGVNIACIIKADNENWENVEKRMYAKLLHSDKKHSNKKHSNNSLSFRLKTLEEKVQKLEQIIEQKGLTNE